jgi:hypothetical protein
MTPKCESVLIWLQPDIALVDMGPYGEVAWQATGEREGECMVRGKVSGEEMWRPLSAKPALRDLRLSYSALQANFEEN